MTDLTRCAWAGVTFADCLRQGFPGRPLIGYCQGPRRLFFRTWTGQTGDPALHDLDQVYEARFFDEDGELRWLRDPDADGIGRAAWITEGANAPCPEGFEPLNPLTDLEAWNTCVVAQGHALLPDILAGQRGQYLVREYLGLAPGQAGEDGNMIVVEQRILGIEPMNQGDKS